MKCKVGDIVLINHFKYPSGAEGSLHSFVVIDIKKDELEIMPFEYLCFLISSNKSKENSPYNLPIKKDHINRLKSDSHVKCDYIYEGIKEDDIIMIVGAVTPEQYKAFIELYLESQEN